MYSIKADKPTYNENTSKYVPPPRNADLITEVGSGTTLQQLTFNPIHSWWSVGRSVGVLIPTAPSEDKFTLPHRAAPPRAAVGHTYRSVCSAQSNFPCTRKNALRTIKTLLKFVSRALSTILALRLRKDNDGRLLYSCFGWCWLVVGGIQSAVGVAPVPVPPVQCSFAHSLV